MYSYLWNCLKCIAKFTWISICDRLDEFKKLNPPIDLIEGAEMEMTIRGDTLLYKNFTGGVGRIQSQVFCEALCDVYFGKDAVSLGHKESVLEGVAKL